MNTPIANRYEFVYFFDITNGNPNGDPDAGNMPRIDPETGHGIVTDVCLKRKVRNYVGITKQYKPPYNIFVREGTFLNSEIERAYEESEKVKDLFEKFLAHSKNKKGTPQPPQHYEDAAREWMCQTYYDVRTFGAVMTTKDESKTSAEESDSGAETTTTRRKSSKLARTAGQVRGPVQIAFARSIDPVAALSASISRICAVSEDNPEQKGVIGRKNYIPYGLYRVHGFISPFFAKQTGFSEDDLELFWEALNNMFEHDRSAARMEMYKRRLIIFKHESELGNAHAHELFARVTVCKKPGVATPRAFSDYEISVDTDNLPSGISPLDK
ncbi:MAG: type I-C CRISPR-associated protein Cas7/Csd2 [bacterium]|nr:type I-C CRISPR-associated protein Cas7/Csd2 [bacterium]